VRWDDLAAFEKRKHHGRNSNLPSLAARQMDSRIEGFDGTLDGFQRKRRKPRS